MSKLLIADAMEESRTALEALMHDRCEIVACADGETAMTLLRDFRPDILVVDLMLAGTDGLSLIRQLRQTDLRPRILVQTVLASPYVMASLAQLGVDYVLRKPCRIEAVEACICDFLSQMQQVLPVSPVGDQMVNQLLMRLGFSPKLDGYGYLAEAIPLYARDPSQAITKELYATVGRPRRKSANLVERSIRSAIDKAWRERDEQIWRQYFRCAPDGTVPRPSNGAFIARMAQFMVAENPYCITA